MKNILKNIWVAVLLAVISAPVAWSQHTMGSGTLAAAVSSNADQITVSANTTDGVAVGDIAFVDREAMKITAVNSLTFNVTRGVDGTQGRPHTSGETVWIDKARYFGLAFVTFGSCTSTSELVIPRIDTATGDLYYCTNSEWDRRVNVGGLKSKLDLHLLLDTTSDDRAVRLNSRNYSTITSGGTQLGFSSKPAQAVDSTGTIQGGEISPRMLNGFTAANAIGLFVDVELKGTTARTVSGDIRALNLEVVADDAGTSTISGNVNAIRIRTAFSATTITGKFVPIRIEAAETQTNSKVYDAVIQLTGTSNSAWGTTTNTGDTEAGYFTVMIGTTPYYVQLFSDSPL